MSASLHAVWARRLFRAPQTEAPADDAPAPSASELAAWFTEGHVLHQTLVPALPKGPAGARLGAERLGRALDGWIFSFESELSEGALISARFSARARHVGALGAVPATGGYLLFEGMVMTRLEGGRAAETWLEIDTWAPLASLGAIEPRSGALRGDAPTAGGAS